MATDTEQQQSKTYPQFTMYRSQQNGKGAASRWQINERGLFLDIANQIGSTPEGNGVFGWRGKDGESFITMKLGLVDIGELLAVLNGIKDGCGQEKMEGGKLTYKNLFHKNANGNTTLAFAPWIKDGRLNGYSLRITMQVGTSPSTSISHSVSVSDAQCLRVLLERSVCMLSNWY